jgi:hypothetical protein|tara:strand:+ start:572 stop:760 length:189 start_codon:yes stop_codon:yes gene_type:complete
MKAIITAMICLTVLEVVALFNGINGTLFSIVIASIAGLGGLVSPQLKLKGVGKYGRRNKTRR